MIRSEVTLISTRVILFLILFILAGFQGFAQSVDTEDPWKAGDANLLFNSEDVPVFELRMKPADITAMKAEARNKTYFPAELSFNGKKFGKVGVRYRGSYGTLFPCLDPSRSACPKISIKIKFDFEKSDTKIRFFGMESLNFNSAIYDPTYLRERLAYDLYRSMGLKAALASNARLSINNEYMGLFVLLENIDKRFAEHSFAGTKGRIYKSVWPTFTRDADLPKSGKNAQSEQTGSWKKFQTEWDAAKEEERPQVLSKWLDMDYVWRYLAVDDAICNFDGITGFYTDGKSLTGRNKNCFWYVSDKLPAFYVMPWDLHGTFDPHNCFDGVPAWNDPDVSCSKTYFMTGLDVLPVMSAACDPLFKTLRKMDQTRYRRAIEELLAGPFQDKTIVKKLDAWALRISEAVKEDMHGPGLEAWQKSIERLKANFPVLRRKLVSIKAGAKAASCRLRIDRINDFEKLEAWSLADGIMLAANPKSESAVSLNTKEPLAGSADMRTDFTFRNDRNDASAAWSQWMSMTLGIEGQYTNASKLRSINLQMKTDEGREIRIDLDGAGYSRLDKGIRFGWTLTGNGKTQTASCSISSAKLPPWAPRTSDDLSKVLGTFKGLMISPQAKGRGLDGILPAGKDDRGFLQIDSIEFVFDRS
jgi:spore coat protein H